MSEEPQSHEDDQLPARRRKLLIVGASIAALIVILVAMILILVFVLGRESCRPVDIRPNIDLTKIEAISSQDDQTLVRFAGYLTAKQEHPDSTDKMKYLELKLQKIHQSYQARGMILVTLHTDCALIDIHLQKTSSNSPKYQFLNFHVKPTDPTRFVSCYAAFSATEFELYQYYSCHKVLSLSCANGQVAGNGSIVSGEDNLLTTDELRIHLFDLELEGDPSLIKKGKFDKVPVSC